MYITGLGGSFFNHPFWRTRFKLSSQSDVDRLRRSCVPYVEIDDELGCGPVDNEPVKSQPQLYLVDRIGQNLAGPVRKQASSGLRPNTPAGRAEYKRAVRSVSRAKSVMHELFNAGRFGTKIPIAEAVGLVEEIDEMFEQGEHVFLDLVRMKSVEEYTYLHSVAVCALMLKLARHLDMPEDQVRECGLAGLLHDVGKMRIPADLLHKPGSLTDDEFEVIKSHADQGYLILRDAPDLPTSVKDVAHLHHEKIDGSGYPLGLTCEQIPLLARMGAICDVYDALTSEREYKAAWAPTDAIEKMIVSTGHFDNALLDAFAKSIDLNPTDTLTALPGAPRG